MKNRNTSKIKEIISDNVYMLGFIKKASPWFIIITIVVSFTALVDTVSNTWFSKIVFDSMEKHTPFQLLIITILILLAFMLVTSAIKTFYNQKISTVAHLRINGYIRSLLFEKTRQLDLKCYENAEFYNKYTRALAEADDRAINVLSSVSQFSYSVITLFTLFSIIIYLDPILLIFAALGAIFSAIISKRLAKLRYEYNYDKTPFDRKGSYIHRVFYEPQYAKDMKMDSMHIYFIEFYKKVISDSIHFIRNRTNKIAFWEFLVGIQNVILQIMMTIFLTWRVYIGILSIGDYAALLNSTFSLMFQLQSFTALIPKFYEHSLYIQNFREIMLRKPEIEHSEGIELSVNDPISFEFCGVSFSYPDSETAVLKNVSLSFTAKKRHAIVGHNGAGKSTIIKLLLRLYEITNGVILVNGKDIKEYNVFSLRRNIATVFQDFQTYAIPVADFILARKYEESADKLIVKRAIECVGLKDKIIDLSNDVHTSLSKEFDENGVSFSGGENQKLALAKAIIKGGSVVIMDEPSSALDPISEYELHKNMLQIAKGKTVVLISHRLSTTKDADIIYYMEHGEVIESGSHSELMKRNERYARMFRVQAESYKQ